MRFVPYSNIYKNGVLACLKRNVIWMRRLNDDKLYKWLLPIIDYPWINQIDSKKFPYKTGIVLLDNNNAVRGFSAVIHSKQVVDGTEKIVVNPSTTVVDKEHKFYFFGMSQEMYKYGDVVFDLSPNEPARRISRDLFGFTIIDNPMYLMRPIFACARDYKLDTRIKDEYISKVLADHGNCGIKCVCIINSNNPKEEAYVVYKVINRIKRLPLRTLCVLHVSNPSFFVRNFCECVSLLTRKEHSLFMADSRYIDISKVPRIHVKKQKYRAVFNPEGDLDYTFLYSELSLLQNEMI